MALHQGLLSIAVALKIGFTKFGEKDPSIVILRGAKNLSGHKAKDDERFFASLRMTAFFPQHLTVIPA
jgi:hypothetical protein